MLDSFNRLFGLIISILVDFVPVFDCCWYTFSFCLFGTPKQISSFCEAHWDTIAFITAVTMNHSITLMVWAFKSSNSVSTAQHGQRSTNTTRSNTVIIIKRVTHGIILSFVFSNDENKIDEHRMNMRLLYQSMLLELQTISFHIACCQIFNGHGFNLFNSIKLFRY